jgi:hypothetical protein
LPFFSLRSFVVGVDSAIRIRQYHGRLFGYYKSNGILSDGLVEAEDLDVAQHSISYQLTLEDLFRPLKHLQLLLQHQEDVLVCPPYPI